MRAIRPDSKRLAIDHFGHQGDGLARRHVGQTDQPRVGRLAHVNEFREVAIERHQDTILGRRTAPAGLPSQSRNPGDGSPAATRRA